MPYIQFSKIALSICEENLSCRAYYYTHYNLFSKENMRKQDSIAVGCILAPWKPYMFEFQLPLSNVAPRGVSAKMHKFEKVSSNLMSEGGRGGGGGTSPGLMSGGMEYPIM